MYRNFLFDFDGTLVASRLLAVRLYNELAAQCGGRPIELEEIGALAALSVPDRVQRLGCPMYKLPALVFEMKKRYRAEAPSLDAVTGMPEVTEEMSRRGAVTGILSSNTEDNIRALLERGGFPSMGFVFSATNLFGKDKALLRLLKARRLAAEDTLYVGDELRDVEACRRIGLPCAAVTWGYDAEELLQSACPRHLLRQPEELLELVAAAGR